MSGLASLLATLLRPPTPRLVVESILVVLVFGRFDLFGLAAETERLSSAIVQRTTASFYRVWSDGLAPAARSSPITVVELDQPFLQHVGASWPLEYSAHAHLLHRIARQQPRAIFLDLFLSQDRGDDAGLGVLVDRIAAAEAAGIPVFVAAPDPCTALVQGDAQLDALEPGRGLLRDVARVARPVVVEWQGFRDAYPLLLHPADVRAPEVGARCAGTSRAWRTPALALFESWCADTKSGACTWRASGRDPAVTFTPPVAVQWGVAVDRRNEDFATLDDCGLVDPGTGDRAAWLLSSLGTQLWRGVRGAGVGSLERCPFAPTVSAAVLYGAAADGTFVADERYDAKLREWFQGRLVLVGAALLGTGDVVRSPVHGQLPGVHLHAMALDNLLGFGDRYVVDTADPRTPARPLLDALWALLAFAVLVIFGSVVARAEDAVGAVASRLAGVLVWFATIAILAAVSVVGLVVVVALALVTDTSVPNWIGILAGASFSLPELTACVVLWKPPVEEEDGRSSHTDESARHAEGGTR